ncbi:MAG: macro domain-containing protein [Oscillospiraceae bacterium]|nr:macro domain-containing protein [Oscillospiraceae bacterium]
MPLQIIRNDLTRMAVSAVVNPTDEQLSGSGGLDAQLHRAAGAKLADACARIGFCAAGDAVLTKGYDLPADYIIHTVGPRWVDGNHGERETLASCYRSALALARAKRFSSVAFPLISAGTFGFPKAEALEIAVREIRVFLSEHEMEITLVVFNRECYEISAERHARVQSFIDQAYVDAHAGFANHRRSESAPVSFEQAAFSSSDAAPSAPAPRPAPKPARPPRPRPSAKLDSVFRPDRMLDESFSQMLLRKIDEQGITDADCYKKANVDRKLFSKIRKNPNYRPSKVTVIAFAIALRLDLDETREMLMKAGYALSRSQRFDVIIEYFIREQIYDIYEINETLFDFDQQLLGA